MATSSHLFTWRYNCLEDDIYHTTVSYYKKIILKSQLLFTHFTDFYWFCYSEPHTTDERKLYLVSIWNFLRTYMCPVLLCVFVFSMLRCGPSLPTIWENEFYQSTNKSKMINTEHHTKKHVDVYKIYRISLKCIVGPYGLFLSLEAPVALNLIV